MRSSGMNQFQANICLICVTFCWSTEVIIFACIPADVPSFATTCITSLIGSVILFACFFRKIKEQLLSGDKRFLLRCLALSSINVTYNLLYLMGLKSFNVTTGAFTLSMTVVVLPVILLSIGKPVGKKTWLSALMVLCGIFINLIGSINNVSVIGLTMITVGCVLRGIYIVKLNQHARGSDPLAISAFISLFGGMISYILWLCVDRRTFASIEWSRTIIASLFIYAYFIIAFAQTLNVFAQRRTTPSSATIIYSLEIIFSVIWGTVLPASIVERVMISPRIIIGMLFVVAGNLVEFVDLGALKRGVKTHEKK